MALSDNEIDYLEENLPELMATATKQAYWQTLASGQSVLIAQNGQLIRVYPDGTRAFVKNINPPIEVELVKTIQLC